MRVTNKHMADAIQSSLYDHAEALLKFQTVVSTGKKINKPSDDPIAIGKILDYRKILSSLDQYQINIDRAKTKVEVIETTLGSFEELIAEAKHAAEEQSNGSSEKDSRATAADQIAEIQKQALLLANTKLDGNYLFSGHNTDTLAFATGGEVTLTSGAASDVIYGLSGEATDTTLTIKDSSGATVRTIVIGDGVTPGDGGSAGLNTMAPVWDGNDDFGIPLPDGTYTYSIAADDAGTAVEEYVRYQGDNGSHQVIVGEGFTIPINVDGNDIFTDVFDSLAQLQNALEDPVYSDTAISAWIAPLENAIDQINKVRAINSSKYQRFEVMEKQLEHFKKNYEDLLDNTESADLEKAVVELQSQQTAYETSLAVASQVIRKSLVNFL